MLIRSENSEDINIIGWQSRKAERRSWSTLAAETHVLQHAIDKAVHIHGVLKQLNQEIVKSTKEERLQKEFAVIRDADRIQECENCA